MPVRENILPRLSGSSLKLIAAVSMFIDHTGMLLFPGVTAFRVIGRLAFPIYGFMIAEGCCYTRNRLRYFLGIFLLAAVCQTAYFVAMGSTYMSVLVTFSLSVPVICLIDRFKAAPGLGRGAAVAAAVAAVYGLNRVLTIDYGFWGTMVPVFAALFQKTRWDALPLRVGMTGLALCGVAASLGGIQWLALAALPLLLCYSGQRGKWRMKYFFYIFYPAHLLLLEGLALLMQYYIV